MKRIIKSLEDICYIWRQEMRQVFRDEGMIIFFLIVPVIYPLLYSWIYNNEVVREVPVVVVDNCRSSLSRQFIRQCDASPDVRVIAHASDIDEAKMLVSRQVAKGIYYLPSDFDLSISRLEQTTVSVYCDMSLMLAYKAIYQTAQAVSQQMGAAVQTRLGGHFTQREAEIAAQPLAFDEVTIFNPSGGYGSFILPAVLMLILQQTLVLGIGLSAGTARETNPYGQLVPFDPHYTDMFKIVLGKGLCYFMVYAVASAWLLLAVPHIFGFPQLASWTSLAALLLPYVLACIFFGMAVSCMVRYRENVMLLIVFVSVPLLFLTGVSWPQSNIPGMWQGVSWLFPSTFGARAYIRLNSMGATLSDVLTEYRILWLQVLAYFMLACLVYGHQIRVTERETH